jgi:putative membrane protein
MRKRTPQALPSKEPFMIEKFAEHSANERTFLAWIRTGIAVIGFGFVIEKFNLFIRAVAATTSTEAGKTIRTELLTGPIGRYEGIALMLAGLVLIMLGYWRFARIERFISETEPRQPSGVQAEIVVTAILLLLVGMYCALIVLG